MCFIKDYWSGWFTGKTTGKEVDAYIRSSFAHLVSEYRYVYYEKCVRKENSSVTHINVNEATDVKEQNPNLVRTQVQQVDNPEENLASLQSEVTSPNDTGNLSTAEEQSQDQKSPQVQAQKADNSLEGLADFQTDSTQHRDANNIPTVDEPTQGYEKNKNAIEATESSKTDSVSSGCACLKSPELKVLLDDFDKGEFEEGKRSLSWNDCALLEASIIQLLDKNQLKTKLTMLEGRYEAVVEPKKYERYKQSVVRVNEEDVDLKERVNFLVWDLYWAYTTAGKVGQLRQRTVKPILEILPIIIAFFSICLLVYLSDLFYFETNVFSTFMIVLSVMFFGAIGALISFQRRMSKLEVRGETFSNYLQLCSLGNDGPLALLTGGFFALLLLILFSSGLANAVLAALFSTQLANFVTPLFPLLYIDNNVPMESVSLTKAIAKLDFIGYASLAKLLVWSFLAGFAEALIPDAMTRLIEKAKLVEK